MIWKYRQNGRDVFVNVYVNFSLAGTLHFNVEEFNDVTRLLLPDNRATIQVKLVKDDTENETEIQSPS